MKKMLLGLFVMTVSWCAIAEYASLIMFGSVTPLYGQFRICWPKYSGAVSYNVYSYMRWRLNISSETQRELRGSTTRNYFIVYPTPDPIINDSGVNGWAYDFVVVGVNADGKEMWSAPDTISMPSHRIQNLDSSNRKYQLTPSRQTIASGETGTIVMEYELEDYPGKTMESWDQTIVWEITSGSEYATLVEDEYLKAKYEQNQLFYYSSRYGVTVRANADLTTRQVITIGGRFVGSSKWYTADIVIEPPIKVSFHGGWSSVLSASSCKYNFGAQYGTFPTATRYGYEFAGWYTADGVRVDETTTASKDVTDLYAHWVMSEPWPDGYHVDNVDGIIWRFMITDGLVTIMSASSVSDSLPASFDIPETLGGRKVTGIGDSAFEECNELTAVSIPASVTNIAYHAFAYCANLDTVNFACENFLEIDIDINAFSYSPVNSTLLKVSYGYTSDTGMTGVYGFSGTRPEKLMLPERSDVTALLMWSFGSAENDIVRDLTIPANIMRIEFGVFEYCDKITTFRFKGRPPIGFGGSYILNHATKIYYPQEYADEWAELVPTEQFAGYEPAGSSAYGLVTFDLGSLGSRRGGAPLVQSVRYGAAAEPPTVQPQIGWKLSGWDADIQSVSSNMTVHAIYKEKDPSEPYEDGDYSVALDDWCWKFSVSDGEATVVSVYRVDGGSRRDAVIPECLGNCPVVALGEEYTSFLKDDSIESIHIPKCVTEIASSVFMGRSSFRSIEVDIDNENFKSIDGILYTKDGTTLLVCPSGRANVVVPKGVTTIGENAFAYSTDLKTVILPAGVMMLDGNAFAYAENLTSITFEGDIPNSIGYNVFEPYWGSCSTLTIKYPADNDSWDPLPDSEYWDCYSRNFDYAPLCGQLIRVSADATGGIELSVEPDWFDNYPNLVMAFGSDRAKALCAKTGKKTSDGHECQVWEDYVAGTDPTDTNSVFTSSIEILNGALDITWSPNLESERTYKIWGSTNLVNGGDWEWPTNALHRFFKVTVEMP